MKLRTHKGTQKRTRRTSTGKFMMQRGHKNHRLRPKAKRQKRLNRLGQHVSSGDVRAIERLLPNS